MKKNIDGKKIRDEILEQLKSDIKHCLIKPCLAVIQVGNDAASSTYIKAKEKACNETGIYFKHIKFDENVKEKEIINKIVELNNDEYVNGILIQLPLPSCFDEDRLINYIARNKDVDGLTDINLGKLFNKKNALISCTPQGIMELLRHEKVELSGKNVTIVGRSKLVGKPLIGLLLNKDATVTVCHSKTVDLVCHTANADVLIVAVGKEKFITGDMVKPGAIVIDVGINRVDGKLCGDVFYDDVVDKVSKITPVPGGVGPMTVAMLMSNVYKAYKSQQKS